MRTILTLALMSLFLQTVAPVGAQAADPCEGIAPTRLDNQLFAVNVEDRPISIREEPRFSSTVVQVVPPGEVMRLQYRNTCADTSRWEFVAYAGNTGWVNEANAWHYTLAPYTLPEPVIVSEVMDGQTHVLTVPLSFTVPADFANVVTMQPRIGTLDREAMRAFPNYTQYVLSQQTDGAEAVIVGTIDVYPTLEWARYSTGIENEFRRLRGLMDRHAPLPLADFETGALLDVPDLPSGGAAQIFSAAQSYVNLQNGPGLRFLTYYAQVTGEIPTTLSYRFEGLEYGGALFVSAEFPVDVPAEALPAFDHEAYITSGDDDGPINAYYRAYLDEVRAGLDTLDAGAVRPNLNVLDSIFVSMSVTAPEVEA